MCNTTGTYPSSYIARTVATHQPSCRVKAAIEGLVEPFVRYAADAVVVARFSGAGPEVDR
jgi:hypothetical protein